MGNDIYYYASGEGKAEYESLAIGYYAFPCPRGIPLNLSGFSEIVVIVKWGVSPMWLPLQISINQYKEQNVEV